MSTTVPPRDDGASVPKSAGSALPNEEALRLAFFARYPTLAAEARTALGDEAAGLTPKVVEGAFVRARGCSFFPAPFAAVRVCVSAR